MSVKIVEDIVYIFENHATEDMHYQNSLNFSKNGYPV